MRVCHCTLGGTRACSYCPNNDVEWPDDVFVRSQWLPEKINLSDWEITIWSGPTNERQTNKD